MVRGAVMGRLAIQRRLGSSSGASWRGPGLGVQTLSLTVSTLGLTLVGTCHAQVWKAAAGGVNLASQHQQPLRIIKGTACKLTRVGALVSA